MPEAQPVSGALTSALSRWPPPLPPCATQLASQLAILANASVLVGLHGANLMNALFMRRRGVLIGLKGSYMLQVSEPPTTARES